MGRPRTHGHTAGRKISRTFEAWRSMRKRCLNPNHRFYGRYGGRGITVCARWEKFEHFLADMGEAPLGLSLDRIDNDGNYEPDNCRWASQSEQLCNSSGAHRGVVVPFPRELRSIKGWAIKLGLTPSAIRRRLNAGWPIERAISEPRYSR